MRIIFENYTPKGVVVEEDVPKENPFNELMELFE
jgi:hypothetical protein